MDDNTRKKIQWLEKTRYHSFLFGVNAGLLSGLLMMVGLINNKAPIGIGASVLAIVLIWQTVKVFFAKVDKMFGD